MRTLLTIATLLLAGYVIAAAALYLLQDQLIFHPRRPLTEPAGPHVRPISLTRPDATLHGWLVNGQHRGPLIVYFGGNAEEVSPLAAVFARLEATTVLMNYRGYGHSTGEPGAEVLIADAAAVASAMRTRLGRERPLILFGRSLGSGIAAITASSVAADGLILLSPYRSLTHLARRFAPGMPVDALLRHRIDAGAALDGTPREVLVLYARQDAIVPTAESQAFVSLLERSMPVQPRVVTFDGTHNTALTDAALWPAIERFVAAVRR